MLGELPRAKDVVLQRSKRDEQTKEKKEKKKKKQRKKLLLLHALPFSPIPNDLIKAPYMLKSALLDALFYKESCY
jgi:hypothetical protein